MTHIISQLFIKIVLLFPIRNRLQVISILSVIVAPLFYWKARGDKEKWTKVYKYEKGTSIPFIWSLVLLNSVSIDFKVELDKQVVQEAMDIKKGVLLIGYHGELMLLIIPHLIKLGFKVVTVGVREQEVIWGTNYKNEIQLSSSTLLKVKDRLRQGEIVALMIDTNEVNTKRITEVDTVFGKMQISTAIFQLAANINCETIFLKYKMKDATVFFDLGRASTNCCYRTITDDYIKFLQSV